MNIVTTISAFDGSASVASGLAILALAVTVGLSIGAVPFRGLKLGISGVLFSALVFRQIGLAIDTRVLDFLRDFALIIFMYAIGLQVGPGFGASLRAEGLRLNVLSICVLLLGALLTAALGPLIPKGAGPGLYCGAFTTTPGLAAAQDALRAAPAGSEAHTPAERTGLAYSITYPFGVVGPMFVIVALRSLFRVRMADEQAAQAKTEAKSRTSIETIDLEVTIETCRGKRLQDYPLARDHNIVFTRLLRDGVVTIPTADTVMKVGDRFRAVGPSERVDELITSLGRRSDVDLNTAAGDITRTEFIVTHRHVLRRSLSELNFPRRAGVMFGIVHRAGVDLVAVGSLRLAFGDRITAVGPKEGLKLVESELGNSVAALDHTQLSPIFLGITLAVLLGSIPLTLPKLHGSIHIGLAAGALFAAIVLSRIRSLGPVVWYMPAAANQLFRDLGLRFSSPASDSRPAIISFNAPPMHPVWRCWF